MALSPQYSWPEPDNSSLVKNGAQDIRALGDAIDTSVWNVGFGQAGKNKIINGAFNVWQRGTSFTPSTGAVFNSDRWISERDGSGATVTTSQQTFTPGTAPVAGYESQFFYRYAQTVAGTGGSFNVIQSQKIEDVRTFANQVVTVSFWAKADATRSLQPYLNQNFGSGGSGTVQVVGTSVSLTTSWVRYTQTLTVPSISGKTVGTSSFLGLQFYGAANTVQTIDIWGVQVEYGSKATPFQTATGTLQGELSACQRYYVRLGSTTTSYGTLGTGAAGSTGGVQINTKLPTTMRTAPTSIDFSTLAIYDGVTLVGSPTAVVILSTECSPDYGAVDFQKAASFTQYRAYKLFGNNSSSAYLGFSAEL
jgi:hypothetical protein